MWAILGKIAVQVAIYAIGHQDVVKKVVDDGKAKNVKGLATDIFGIVADVEAQKVAK